MDARTLADTYVKPPPEGARRAPPRSLKALALIVGLATLASSFLVLRQAPVAPEDHMNELAEIRPLVVGEKLLFLGRDNFVLWELRGSKPFTHVRNFYDPYFVAPNTELRDVFSKFDFDAVTAATLDRFPYVLTTRAPYASGPPPGHEVAASTDSYVLWKRVEPVGDREPAEGGPPPGARLAECRHGEPARGAALARKPVLASAGGWSEQTLESGATAELELELPRGRWDLSLRYDATRPLTLAAGRDGAFARLPGNLDYRGTSPFWAAGRIVVDSDEPVRVVASIERPPASGRLLGAKSIAHLGELAATPTAGGHPGVDPAPGSGAALRRDGLCGEYVDWYLP